jgi:hypothetical protein
VSLRTALQAAGMDEGALQRVYRTFNATAESFLKESNSHGA